MFSLRVLELLGLQLGQRTDDAEAGVAGLDNVVDVAILGCIVRVGEELGVLGLLLGNECLGIFLLLGLLGIEDGSSTAGTHYGNLGCRPCVVHVATELLTAHHDVATTIALAQGNGYLGHSSFAEGVEQLGTVEDNGVVLLACTGEEAWNVDECYQRNVEGVAEAYEAGCLA